MIAFNDALAKAVDRAAAKTEIVRALA